MSKVVKKEVKYLGVKEPSTYNELKVEVCGLKHAVKQAEEMIARLEQSVALFELKAEEQSREQTKSGAEETNPETQAGSEEGASVSG